MAKPVWLGRRSTDPVIRARAFGAVGVLTAANWKPSDGNYDDALAGIVKAGSGLISWRHPSSSTIISGVPFDEARLARAWDHAFASSGSAPAENPIARLTIDTQSFAGAGITLQEGVADTYQALLSPWMNRLDDTQPGQIAALSFAAFDHAAPHDWNWPIKVGVPRQHDLALSDRLNATRAVRRESIEVVSPDAARSDILMLSGPEFNALSRSNQSPPGLAIIYLSSSDAAGGIVTQIAANISTPTAVIGVGQKSLPKFLNEFSDEIAHNKPLDVAIFDAYRTIFNPKGSRGDDLAPLVLLAPRTNRETVFNGIRIENRVKEFAERLNRLPGNVVVGRPPDAAKHIGIDKSRQTVDDYRKGISRAIESGELNFGREILGSKGLRSTTKVIADLEEKLSISPSNEAFERATNESASASDSQPFSAFPRLDAPAAVETEKSFEIKVGFSDVPDSTQPDLARITISDAGKEEDILVFVSAQNGQVDDPNFARLKLELDASAKFTIRAAANCDFVRVTAKYFFRNEPAGSIVRTVPVAGRPAPEPDHPPVPKLFWPVLKTVVRKSLDLVLLVDLEEEGRITWQAIAGENISKPVPMLVGDARQFAAQFDKIQKNFGHTGKLSHTNVQFAGQTITSKIPEEILSDFIAPCLKKFEETSGEKSEPHAPRILILTNEPYIPWELALLQPSVTGRKKLEYFGAMARIGRWWVGPRTAAPEPNLKIGPVSVICAEVYVGNQQQLPEAIAEKDWLHNTFNADRVLGNFDPVIAWIDTLPKGPGHLAHFALHGYSNPEANDQLLMLGDGKNLTPPLLSGVRTEGEVPKYGMVFLNACQVGTAGVALGQLSGFPGALLAAGTDAVIGPIWEVNDVAARTLVERFYQDTLRKNVPVSEALRQIRADCDPTKTTTTPLAYIFYGHPDLVLENMTGSAP